MSAICWSHATCLIRHAQPLAATPLLERGTPKATHTTELSQSGILHPTAFIKLRLCCRQPVAQARQAVWINASIEPRPEGAEPWNATPKEELPRRAGEPARD
jgi:hypothetical protein